MPEPLEQGLPQALTEFLATVSNYLSGTPPQGISTHLRLPAQSGLIVRGSPLGHALWESPTGRSLLQLVCRDPIIGQFVPSASDHVALAETKGRLAAFAEQALHSGDIPSFVQSYAPVLLGELRNQTPSATAAALVLGLESPDEPLTVAPYVTIEPASDPWLTHFAQALPGGAAAVPVDATTVLTLSAQTHRNEFGAAAAVSAYAFAGTSIETLRKAIWLGSGSLPNILVTLVVEQAMFPSVISSMNRASFRESGHRATGDDRGILVTDRIGPFYQLLQEKDWRDNRSLFEEDLADAVWSALLLADTATLVSDGDIVVLSSFAALEGMLTGRDEKDKGSKVGQRLAAMVGTTKESARRIASVSAKLYEARNHPAHGSTTPVEQHRTILTTAGLPPGVQQFIEHPSPSMRAGWLALRLLRSVLGSFLLLAANNNWQRPVSHEHLLGLIRMAAGHAGNESQAQAARDSARRELQSMVPDWLKDPLTPEEEASLDDPELQ